MDATRRHSHAGTRSVTGPFRPKEPAGFDLSRGLYAGVSESQSGCSVRGMDLRVSIEPQQGASYDDLVRVAKAADELGFDGFFRSDHYLTFGGDGLPGPTDAWVTLGALARETSRVRLGTLLSPVTFRLPGPLAHPGGAGRCHEWRTGRAGHRRRMVRGGTRRLRYSVPSGPERFDRLIEQVAIIDGLWRTPLSATYSFEGRYYRLTDSPALPKPVQRPRPPIIIGGLGKRRSLELAAGFADEFNVGWQDVQATASILDRTRAVIDRDIVYSAAQVLCVGRNDAEVARRAAAIRQRLDDLNTYGLAATPAQVVDRIGRFAEHGITRFYLQTLDLDDLDHLELVATQIAPQL
jgi:alkanesulfonate monooxygenase SsuD/methylene tetrahydromethanopterin reductase-like flavin-dependent oxidoreductase (luciferase family)